LALERLEQQRALLREGRFFKLICGAGNEDAEEVSKLSLVAALAGAAAIDLSARADVVSSARRAIDDAVSAYGAALSPWFVRPYLTVSVGMAGDPHVRKARILPEACTECNACIPVCPTDAIPASLVIIENRCIGCGACAVACQDDAVAYAHQEIEMERVLRECLQAGAENIELHASVRDHEPAVKEWELVTRLLPGGFVSVCLDRRWLSNHDLKQRLELLLPLARDRMMVQADGIPMSGGKDDYNTTLQAIATADIIAKFNLPVPLLLSGGTNAKTIELAARCGVPYAGVSIGTFARHLVYDCINHPAFPGDGLLEAAVARARDLVATCRPEVA
jgi:ferredoxin